MNLKRIRPWPALVATFLLMTVTVTLAAPDKAATDKAASGKAAGKDPSQKWEKNIAAFEAADKTQAPPQGAVLFIGASGITRWKTLQADFPEQKVINRGFGGSQLIDSVYYADRVIIPYKPRLIVLQAGGNDLKAGKTAEQVYADFKAFAEKVHANLPQTRICYLCIPPSVARWEMADVQKKTNHMIKDYITAGSNMAYIDLWPVVLGSDGKPRPELFVEDHLHPNAEGYKVWTAAIKPFLQ
jgi:lysophospholipase L1-like esterase